MGQIKNWLDIVGFWERGEDFPIEYQDMIDAMGKLGRDLFDIEERVKETEALLLKMEEVAPDKQAFEAALDWLDSTGFKFVSAWLAHLSEEKREIERIRSHGGESWP